MREQIINFKHPADCITDPTENKLLLETKNKNDEVLVFDDEIRKEVLGIF